jgi:hypothetical protein
MAEVKLEVIRIAMNGDRLFLETSYQSIPDQLDPVSFLVDSEPKALTHSTSWRWENGQLLLTFVQVFPDDYSIPENILAAGTTYHDASSLPHIECHAVRHLYFLLHTDEEIAAVPDLENFWKFAHDVVDIHHPAVAGFVGSPNH